MAPLMVVPSVCVVMPTRGRPTLPAAIASVFAQLGADDRLIVVEDSEACPPLELPAEKRIVRARAGRAGSRFGNFQRDVGLELAQLPANRTTHLAFLDDDDRWEPGAIAIVRKAVAADPQAAHIFRARWGRGHHAAGTTLWADKVVLEQNIATCMVVLPNRRYRCSWMDGNDAGTVSDYAWLAAAISECHAVRWHPETIATVRPV